MHMTLPQRMYLLMYTVDKKKFEVQNLQFRGQKVRAAALAQLLHGKGTIVPISFSGYPVFSVNNLMS